MNPLDHFDTVNQELVTIRRFVEVGKNRGFMLYLTGSRFFGTAKRHSDWDFILQSGDHGKWLKEMGFQQEEGGKYPDLLTTEVWWCGELRAHVQVVKDVGIKLAAQAAIKKTNALAIAVAHTHAEARITMRRLIWDLAIEAVRG